MNKRSMLRAHAVLATAAMVCSLRPVAGSDAEVVQIKPTAAVMALASDVKSGGGVKDSTASSANDTASPCDRYLRSAEVEVRGPRNHKFVTSNGWADRQRPKPEINVYAHVEEVPTVQSPSAAAAATAAYYQQQQRETYYRQTQQQHAQQPPTVRTSKRIIYYATLPDVIRPPVQGTGFAQQGAGYAQLGSGYAQPGSGYPPAAADPYALGPGPFSADFRQLDRNAPPDSLQHNRLAPYENAYNRAGGDGGGAVTSVTSKSSAVQYNSRYDEPAEFREPFFRPNEFTSSKFASWAEPFYKSWTSSPPSWGDKDSPSAAYGGRIGDSPSFSWDRDPPLLSRWDSHGGSALDRSGGASPWENRGSSWDRKELVEVPLQLRKPNRGGSGIRPSGRENDFEPEVAVVHSGVIDVRGDRRQDGSIVATPPPPQQQQQPPRFAIIDVDPKPFQQPQMMRHDERGGSMMVQQQQPHKMQQRYDAPQQQKPMRYEAYTPIQPIQPPGHQQHLQPPPSSMRYEQQYRQPPQQSSSSARDGQNQPPKGYYEAVKNTHEYMTSWTEVSEHGDGDVTPTHSVDIASAGNSSMKQNGTRIAPNAINVTKLPK